MNDVRIKGTIVRDPETIETRHGNLIWKVTLAINGARYDVDQRDHVVTTVFVRVTAYGWAAEWLESKQFFKGEELFVQGELDQQVIEVKDGEQEHKTRVTAHYVVPTRRKTAVDPSPPVMPGGEPEPGYTPF